MVRKRILLKFIGVVIFYCESSLSDGCSVLWMNVIYKPLVGRGRQQNHVMYRSLPNIVRPMHGELGTDI